MNEYDLDKSTFMGGWFIENEVCDRLVKLYYDNISITKKGMVGNGRVDVTSKKSNELVINVNKNESWIYEYRSILKNLVKLYIKKYPSCNEVSPYKLYNFVKIQHYKPSEGFYKWHAENTGSSIINSGRHLVFMTYLNDVDDGGTEFLHQNLKIPSKKGLTLIWPAAWTHTHRGVINYKEDKFIITGWLNFNIDLDTEIKNLVKHHPNIIEKINEEQNSN